MSEDAVLDLPENLTAKETSRGVNDKILSKSNQLLEKFKQLLIKNNDAGFILPVSGILSFDNTQNIDHIVKEIVCNKIVKAGYEVESGYGDSDNDILVLNPLTINYRKVRDYVD